MSAWSHLDIEPGEYFAVGGAYFRAALYGDPHDFGGTIGECIPALRLRIDLDEVIDISQGGREWVQTASLSGRRWRTEGELREHLYETEFDL